MFSAKRRLRAASWIAILAVCASVLAPVASRALAAWSGPGSPWDELCTSLGIKRTANTAADAQTERPGTPASAERDAACPYCLPSTNLPALPVQPPAAPPAANDGSSRYLFFFIGAAPARPVTPAARPRAPPLA